MIAPLARLRNWLRGEAARVALMLLATAIVASWSDAVRRTDDLLYDFALRAWPRPVADDIVIIAVDEKALAELGRWPWSREVHARMIERLTRAGARAVGVDIMFSEPEAGDPQADARLAGAIAASGKVVLPVFPELRGPAGRLGETAPLPLFANAAARLGHVDVELDTDAVARGAFLKAGLGSPVWPALALAMIEVDGAEPWLTLPGTRRGGTPAPQAWTRDFHVRVPFAGPPGSYRQLSYADVLSEDFIANSLAGKFVLLGATAQGLGQSLPTPVSAGARPMPGVEFNANLLDALRHGTWIVPLPAPLAWLLIATIAIVPALTYPLLAPRNALALNAVLIAFAGAGSAVLLVLAHRWLAPSPAIAALLVSYPLWSWRRIEAGTRALGEERERARATLHAIDDAVVTTDVDGAIVYMNPVAEQLTGVPLREARGVDLRNVFRSQDAVEHGRIPGIVAQAVAERRPVRSPVHARLTDRVGDGYALRVTASPVIGHEGRVEGVVLALNDMTESLAMNRRIEHQATHDALTELPNRTLLTDRLRQAIVGARRTQECIAVVFVDLNGFKRINDSLGHAGGDALLRDVAERLNAAGRSRDTVARWSGDVFVVLLEGVRDESQVAAAVRKVLDRFQAPFHVDDQELFVSASAGASVFPRDGEEPELLLANANTALHRGKQGGPGSLRFYAEHFNAHTREFLETEKELRYALQRGELELYYQPQVTLHSGAVTGVEALLRWRHPRLGLLQPGQFIALAEQSELIHRIGAWALNTACQQSARWRAQGFAPIKISVNVSPRQFARREIVDTVGDALRVSGADPASIMLELTESTVMQDVERVAGILAELKGLGVQMSIDDFGTGYSSLTYLKRFPIDEVKIDKSFVQDITTDPDDAAISQAVIAMARSMEIAVVAEGVETRAQLELLREWRCDAIQGFYFSPPVPAADLDRLLAAPRPMQPGAAASLH
ncbi:MAG: EAL domain-containing protein [Gammaproteobacteria bacterium]